jgi:HYR domain
MKFPQVRSTMMRAVVFAIALVVISPLHAFAATRVLILVAEDPSLQTDLVNDVKAKLEATGRLEQVDVFDARLGTPSLPQLLGYDAVMTWPDDFYQDRVALGNVLADYVDLGHGVVQTMFSFDPDSAGLRLGGRWESGGYQVFANGPASLGNLSLVADLPQHPILAGVSNVALLSGFFETGMQVASCAQVVAHWSSGDPLAAWCAGPQQGAGRVVALNMYPPSTDAYPFAWDASTQGGLLMANTLVFAGTVPSATNHPPTANAGLDQVLEATGPAGAAFTVTGAASDPDGDALTVEWLGGGFSGHSTSLSGTAALPAAVNSASYTLFFKVDDGHAVATDDVVITVRDTTGPVLANVPATVLTATATSDAGANVPYGPVTATDLVDGARPVVCSKSGVFPVGDTVVTCSSSDTRGNSSSKSFTVRVTDVTTPGVMVGVGLVRAGGVNYEFEFAVAERARERAALQVRVTNVQNHNRNDRFCARTTDFVAFSDDPTVRPGRSRRPQVDSVLFSGAGDWNGHAGYRYEVSAVDRGDSAHRNDTVRITIKAANGSVVASVDGVLTSGFVESARLRR